MEKCEVTIVLDEPAREFLPGETVKGRVRVVVHKELRCESLEVVLRAVTSGKGNGHATRCESKHLYQGVWRAGETYEYAFAVGLPHGEMLFEGHLFRRRFRIGVEANIPWGPDVRTSVWVKAQTPAEGLAVSWREDELATRAHAGCFGVSAAGLLLGVLLFFSLGGFGLEEVGVWAFGIAIVVMAAGVVASLSNYLAQARAGKVRMSLFLGNRGGYRESGDDGTLLVQIGVKAGATVTAIRATLRVQEVAVRGAGSRSQVFRHTAHEEEVMLVGDGAGVYQGRLRLPSPGAVPYTYKVKDNTIEWSVTGHVDIPGWPDWRNEVPLTVLPEGRTSMGAS